MDDILNEDEVATILNCAATTVTERARAKLPLLLPIFNKEPQ